MLNIKSFIYFIFIKSKVYQIRLIKAATNAPRINLIGYVCCLKRQKSSVQYWTFMCRETLQKNKFWLHHLIIRSQALGRLRPGLRFYWNSSVSHNQEGLWTSIYKQTLCFTMKLLFAGEIVTSRQLSICRATLKHCPHKQDSSMLVFMINQSSYF